MSAISIVQKYHDDFLGDVEKTSIELTTYVLDVTSFESEQRSHAQGPKAAEIVFEVSKLSRLAVDLVSQRFLFERIFGDILVVGELIVGAVELNHSKSHLVIVKAVSTGPFDVKTIDPIVHKMRKRIDEIRSEEPS